MVSVKGLCAESGSSPHRPARGVGTPPAPCTPVQLNQTEVTLRKSQLQGIRELDEAEGLDQIRAHAQGLDPVAAGLVDAGADDREVGLVVLQLQGCLERLRVGRLDED